VKQYPGREGGDDWYLIRLTTPCEYDSKTYDQLAISSRWADCFVGQKEATAVFILLVPNPETLQRPSELDRSLYIAWGFSAKRQEDIRR
jgi:hypothetical protein